MHDWWRALVVSGAVGLLVALLSFLHLVRLGPITHEAPGPKLGRNSDPRLSELLSAARASRPTPDASTFSRNLRDSRLWAMLLSVWAIATAASFVACMLLLAWLAAT